jgi:hypothetical protein
VKFLEGFGYAGSNDRAMINVLKALGFRCVTAQSRRSMDDRRSPLI